MACDAVSGTERAHGTELAPEGVRENLRKLRKISAGTVLRNPYAMSGTEIAFGAKRRAEVR
eukprot:3354699-Rhodomonas_salina.1